MLCGGVRRRGRPRRGGWSHSPPVGKGGDVDDMACGRVGGMLVGEAKAVELEAMAFAARSTGVGDGGDGCGGGGDRKLKVASLIILEASLCGLAGWSLEVEGTAWLIALFCFVGVLEARIAR